MLNGYLVDKNNITEYTMIKDTSVHSFILNSIKHYHSMEPIAGDASTRRYYRIFTDKNNYILCYDPNLEGIQLTEYPYKIVYDLLQAGSIHVPKIISLDIKLGLLLVEDIGDDLIESYIADADDDAVLRVYKQIIKILIKIQSIKSDSIPFNLSFNKQKLQYEFEFFIDHALLSYFKSDMTEAEIQVLKEKFEKISGVLDKPDWFVFTHRDFHSRNIIYFKKKLYLIDFQDARMGLPQYDLVSLLRDSYVRLSEDNFQHLKYYYYDMARDAGIHSFSNDEFDYYFDLMAFQRNIKALGTFGYMAVEKMNDRYVQYIQPTIDYLPEYANRQSIIHDIYTILKKHFI